MILVCIYEGGNSKVFYIPKSDIETIIKEAFELALLFFLFLEICQVALNWCVCTYVHTYTKLDKLMIDYGDAINIHC